jgi:hypothetical protein
LVVVLLVGIPASVAIATLKYRLYDLALVVRKTVVFGLLAAFVTVVYAGIVRGIGAIVGSKSSTSLSFVAAAALADLFQPARDTLGEARTGAGFVGPYSNLSMSASPSYSLSAATPMPGCRHWPR